MAGRSPLDVIADQSHGRRSGNGRDTCQIRHGHAHTHTHTSAGQDGVCEGAHRSGPFQHLVPCSYFIWVLVAGSTQLLHFPMFVHELPSCEDQSPNQP